MKDVDWKALIALAKGSEGVAPLPEQLEAKLQAWSLVFEHAEKGPPLLADLPEPVQKFLEWISEYPGRGRPCSDQLLQSDAANAWDHVTTRGAVDARLMVSRLLRQCTGTRDGINLQVVLEILADERSKATGEPVTDEAIRNIAYPRKHRKPSK